MQKAIRKILPLSLLLLASCSSLTPVPEAPEATRKQADEAYARVLKKFVDAEGRTNFRGLGADLADMKLYVKFISKMSEKGFANKADRFAFLINAYNALSMYNVIARDYPEDNGSFFKRYGFFVATKFVILGEEKSLYTFENEVLRKEGDPRVHVVLNCMAASCPRLPREPLSGPELEKQLEREALKFYNEERNVRTDDKEKIVWVSEILDFFTDDFLTKAPTLIDYINKYRKVKVPKDYKVKFIPYDWTIYKQPEAKAAAPASHS